MLRTLGRAFTLGRSPGCGSGDLVASPGKSRDLSIQQQLPPIATQLLGPLPITCNDNRSRPGSVRALPDPAGGRGSHPIGVVRTVGRGIPVPLRRRKTNRPFRRVQSRPSAFHKSAEVVRKPPYHPAARHGCSDHPPATRPPHLGDHRSDLAGRHKGKGVPLQSARPAAPPHLSLLSPHPGTSNRRAHQAPETGKGGYLPPLRRSLPNEHGASQSTARRRVITSIEVLRPAHLGIDQCDQCGHRRICYYVCRLADARGRRYWPTRRLRRNREEAQREVGCIRPVANTAPKLCAWDV